MTDTTQQTAIYCAPTKRHDFVLLFDVTDGNPNGDPDGGNLPRTDPETMQGLVTDVCLKRKIRNYVATYGEYEASDNEKARLKIFIEHHGVLNSQIRRAYIELGIPTGQPAQEEIPKNLIEVIREAASQFPSAFTFHDDESDDELKATLEYSGELTRDELKEALKDLEILENNKTLKKFIDGLVKKAGKPAKNRDNANRAREWMCQNFYDIRMFGAVLSTGLGAGQVRGPLQLTFSRSIDPVLPQDLGLTRVAVTDEKDREKLQTMGRKTLIPYGLYITHGFFSPYLAEQTGVTSDDLELFWDALMFMWDLDRSASRGQMSPRGLYIFSHEKKLGNAPAHKLFERIQVQRKDGILTPRKFTDYDVIIQESDLPPGITLTKLLEG